MNRVAGLTDEIMRDPFSHCNAAVAGWSFVPDPTDVLFRNWVDVTAQMNKKRNAAPIKPVERPWERSNRPVWRVPDPNRDERRAKLRARLRLNY